MKIIKPLTPKTARWPIVFEVNKIHSSTETDVEHDHSHASKLVKVDAAPEGLQAEGKIKEDDLWVGVAQVHPYLGINSNPEVHLHRNQYTPEGLSAEHQEKKLQITSEKEKLR